MKRREFLTIAGLAPFFGLRALLGEGNLSFRNKSLVGKMTRDVNKVVDLHPELHYKIISEAGSIMSDGLRLPDLPDGMGSFNVDNNIVLVRNHELDLINGMKKSAFSDPVNQMNQLGNKHYDKNAIGGTTTVVLDKSSKKLSGNT